MLLDGKADDLTCSQPAHVRQQIPLADGRLVLIDMLDTTWPIGLNSLAGIDLTRPGAVVELLFILHQYRLP